MPQEKVLKDREVARQVLYVCLDWSMRLMHPLLPYLTEDERANERIHAVGCAFFFRNQIGSPKMMVLLS